MGGERRNIRGNIRVATRSPSLKRNPINPLYDLTAQLGRGTSPALSRVHHAHMYICQWSDSSCNLVIIALRWLVNTNALSSGLSGRVLLLQSKCKNRPGEANHTVAVGNGAAGSKGILQLNTRLCGELKGRRDMVAFLRGGGFLSLVKFARWVRSLD